MRDIGAVTIKVFDLGNGKSTRRVFRADRGMAISERGIERILEMVADDLEKRFPEEDFSLVPVGKTTFNFVHRGKRGEAANDPKG